MNDSQVKDTVKNIKNKKYTPWKGMRDKDKEYFKDWEII